MNSYRNSVNFYYFLQLRKNYYKVCSSAIFRIVQLTNKNDEGPVHDENSDYHHSPQKLPAADQPAADQPAAVPTNPPLDPESKRTVGWTKAEIVVYSALSLFSTIVFFILLVFFPNARIFQTAAISTTLTILCAGFFASRGYLSTQRGVVGGAIAILLVCFTSIYGFFWATQEDDLETAMENLGTTEQRLNDALATYQDFVQSTNQLIVPPEITLDVHCLESHLRIDPAFLVARLADTESRYVDRPLFLTRLTSSDNENRPVVVNLYYQEQLGEVRAVAAANRPTTASHSSPILQVYYSPPNLQIGSNLFGRELDPDDISWTPGELRLSVNSSMNDETALAGWPC
ncbi:MAG: hypothetical protein AAF414_18675 [Pseudomonadota bacterium]